MKKKILLVEHNPDTIDVITEILYLEIFDITVAGDAETAKKLLSKYEFHLVITEALLPKSHGFVLAKYISETFPEVKIIIISEKLKKMDYKREALQHGACEFIERPLDAIKFKKKIVKHLDIKEKDDTGTYHAETTNIHVIPLLDDLKSDKEKKSGNGNFEDIMKDIKIKEDTDSYKIELD
jgi:DNA-binding NtrC family response regulator